MKHPARVEDYLDHIAQAIQRATEYVEGVGSRAAFGQSQRDQAAVIRNIEIMGRQVKAARPRLRYICGFECIGRGTRSVNAATSPIFKINLHKGVYATLPRARRSKADTKMLMILRP
jgi:hypothetical protein